jgi:starvation-inducible DNA-binding protein
LYRDVFGFDFADCHQPFDDQDAEILAVTDAVAQHTWKMSNTNVRSIVNNLRCQTISDNNVGFGTLQNILGDLHADNFQMADSFCRIYEVANQAKNKATSGLIDAWTAKARHRAWFVGENRR